MISPEVIESFGRHLQAAVHAEQLIAEARVAHFARRAGLLAFAGLVACFGLAALDAAGYLALAPVLGNPWAMATVGASNLGIALVVVLVARSKSGSVELKLARELRGEAFTAIDLDMKLALGEIRNLVRSPLECLVGPATKALANLLTGILRSRRSERVD